MDLYIKYNMAYSNKVAYKAILYTLLCLVVIIILAFNHIRMSNREWVKISENEEKMLSTGDIIFTEGVSFKSDIVRLFSFDADSKYSHCGLVIKDSLTHIVHMSIDKDMILCEEISDFLTNNRVAGFSVCRIRDCFIGSSLTQEVSCLLDNSIAFDNKYDASQSNELYCSELICMIYKELYQINLYPRDDIRKVIYPNEVFDNSRLIKIL